MTEDGSSEQKQGFIAIDEGVSGQSHRENGEIS